MHRILPPVLPPRRLQRTPLLTSRCLLLTLAAGLFTACVGPFHSPAADDAQAARRMASYRTDFEHYRGTEASLPPGMFVTADGPSGETGGDSFDPFTGVHEYSPNSAYSFDGFGAFTADRSRYSFGIREHGPVDMQNARLYLEYSNTTVFPIIGFEVSYEVQVWYLGQRDNQIRLKYNTDSSGFGDLADIAATRNPMGDYTADGLPLDGTRSVNSVRVRTSFMLEELQQTDGSSAGIPTLQPGAVGYFRWQFSNAEHDDGGIRSGLALDRIRITPILAGEQ
ncbi:hypothetical protein [Spirochaeta africana]|uniref:Uncharacterized protein n=1 Tax=Spirochaeta africana (strain ATCC 700263 / DSM 8902 / Z-7692) TaxID=889378 RepID=H9UF36_SPIAZ|nr:hypothetical protein [Spirochaeta africana]AFG36129.1 hypothetical protein Spiaf_0019 [Spirochaeta africana DSM 8902]